MSFQKVISPLVIIGLAWVAAFCISSCVPASLIKGDEAHDLRMSAQQGDANAQVLIGEKYEFGASVPANLMMAVQWYGLAARQGHPDAQLYLGLQYERGEALRRNSAEALTWLFKAAEQGQQRAQLMLAVMYLKDKGHRREFAKKIRGYRQGAERGNAAMQYCLGWVYDTGAGLPVNPPEALKWYLKSARQGYAKAALTLGSIYLEGKKTPANVQAAQTWFLKSAEADIEGRVRLCQLYKTAGASPDKSAEASTCVETVLQNADATLRSDINRRRMILDAEKERHPVVALRTCRRLADVDPAYGNVSQTCAALAGQIGGQWHSTFLAAESALAQKDENGFREALSGLLTPENDEERLRRLIVSAWRGIEEETRAREKMAQDLLRPIEAAERSAAFRKKNAEQISRLISAFNAAVASGLADHPADPALASLARKGKNVIASLQQKMRPPREVDEKPLSDLPDEDEVEPGEDEYKEAHALFGKGNFEEAANLFEKTTRIRGSRHIASAYLYLGIIHLARINPAHVHEARKRHLKGLACFQNALRFESAIALPEGFDKYQPVFDEAKKRLHE